MVIRRPTCEGMVKAESHFSKIDIGKRTMKTTLALLLLLVATAASADETVKLTPHRVLSLEGALEFIADDECVEVTPHQVRLRKVVLPATERARLTKARKHAAV